MSFKIYPDFESLVQRINKDNNASYTENIKSKFLAVLFIKFVLMIDLEKQLFFIEKKMQFIDPLHQLLKNKNTVERL